MRLKTLGAIYVQTTNDVVIWRNSYGVFLNDPPTGGNLANNVTSYAPSVSGILQFNDTLSFQANSLLEPTGSICAEPPVVDPHMPSAAISRHKTISKKSLTRNHRWKKKQKVKVKKGKVKDHFVFKLVRAKKEVIENGV